MAVAERNPANDPFQWDGSGTVSWPLSWPFHCLTDVAGLAGEELDAFYPHPSAAAVDR